MNFKLSTKEKFHEIDINEDNLTANLAGDFYETIASFLEKEPFNTILLFTNVNQIDEATAHHLKELHELFYTNEQSFVLTEISKNVLDTLISANIADELNITPTLSEAWDMVQMEEVERELLRDFDDDATEQ
ncbi:STAS domain-containing protein [Polluticaenibacter yanchengensis]|uniref:STAS domain-containing protein n=1 Tax=Polluticaenibacter yanchengensis TaxID=3014562 RepID=A0ABT4UNN8_9BACT|nr:STAS domain-containing protein [Chitinophagaceae bacterium LY-5]